MRWHRRLVWMIVILISAFSAAAVHAQIPDGAQGQSYYVAFPTRITVDGVFNDWARLPRQSVTTGPMVPDDPAQRGVLQFAAAADFEHLYLMIEVNDLNIIANQHDEQYWFEDSVEVYINATGQRDLTAFIPGVVQLTLPAASIGLPIDQTIVVGTNSTDVPVRAIVVSTPNGYAIEAAVPLATSVWNIAPAQDGRLGFQIQLNGASVLDRDMKLSWSVADETDESWTNPSVFGELIFWRVNNAPFAPVPTKPVVVGGQPTMIVIPPPPVVLTSTPGIILPTVIPFTETPVTPDPTLESEATGIIGPELETAEPEATETQAATEAIETAEVISTEVASLPTDVAVLPTDVIGPQPEPTQETAGFTVVGPKIYDPNGEEFIAKGVNISGYNSVWSRKSIRDIELIDQCWNFNLVRINNWMFKGRIEYEQHEVNNNIDELITDFTRRGIVVVLEAHDFIGGYYEGEDLEVLIDWFTEYAERYRDNPYVWFDIMNEPGGRNSIDVVQWVDMHGRVIEAIRGTGNDSIIIVEGAFGGQDNNRDEFGDPVTDSAILQYSQDILNYNGTSYSNIVFSIHTWDLWNQGDEKLDNYLQRVEEQGLAMIIGEYGVRSDRDTRAAAESTFNVAIPRGVGRIVWHWDGSDWNDLTTPGGGWMINDCLNPTNLSWMGQKIWDDNHSEE